MTAMRLLTVDVESFWDTDYSLSRMSPLEYVMHPRFELQMMSIKYDDLPTDVFVGKEIEPVCRKIKWDEHMVVGHNLSGFDAYVLAYRLGIRPRMWGCTLAMARPLYAKQSGLSLDALCRFLGIGRKSDTASQALVQTKGKRLANFTQAELNALITRNREDADLDRELFRRLRPHFPGAELWQIDAIIRMRTEPRFVLDTDVLDTAASIERSNKHKAVLDLARKLGVSTTDEDGESISEDAIYEHVRAQLASAQQFSDLLERLGVEVPLKPSPKDPNKLIPALAKTDEAFLALQEDPDETVAAAARCRLAVKSTLLETRIEKFKTAGTLAGGRLPIPLRFCGADTTGRDSGEEYNPQNMTRIDPDRPKTSDALRLSLRAEKDHLIGVSDQSNIELRVNHFLWKVPSSMQLYQADPAKADLYRAFAADSLFLIPPEKIIKSQRQVGKVAQLGLGFGAGAVTFQRVARIQGGIKMPLQPVEGEDTLSASQVVQAWRGAYDPIVQGWKTCGRALRAIALGHEQAVDPWGLVHTCREGLVLPSGRLIRYPDLREEEDGKWPDGRPKRSWFYAHGRHKARLTGPKVCENIVQALARDSIFDCAVEFFRRTQLRPILRVHDELVYMFLARLAQELLQELQAVMRTPPKWWPQLVVWSEGDVAESYGLAK
jgi:DNA polymerase III epsilon subunit-like protein